MLNKQKGTFVDCTARPTINCSHNKWELCTLKLDFIFISYFNKKQCGNATGFLIG